MNPRNRMLSTVQSTTETIVVEPTVTQNNDETIDGNNQEPIMNEPVTNNDVVSPVKDVVSEPDVVKDPKAKDIGHKEDKDVENSVEMPNPDSTRITRSQKTTGSTAHSNQ